MVLRYYFVFFLLKKETIPEVSHPSMLKSNGSKTFENKIRCVTGLLLLY